MSPAEVRIWERLERVRELSGLDDVKPFYLRLAQGDPHFVSYNGALPYHAKDPKRARAASAEYLARVVEVFSVRSEWLLMGRGAMTEAEEKQRLEEEAQGGSVEDWLDMFQEAFEPHEIDFRGLSVSARGEVLTLWGTLLNVRKRYLGPWADEDEGKVSAMIAAAVATPLKELEMGVGRIGLDTYVILVCEALLGYANSMGMKALWPDIQRRKRKV